MIGKERSERMNNYYTYKEYLMNLYGEKTYKLPIAIPVTCPNRDGHLGHKGCYFCSEKGTGFEHIGDHISVEDQLLSARDKVIKRYKAKKFIGYFQNYTNTYLPKEKLLGYLKEAASCDLVGLDIATRPDCLSEDYLQTIKDFSMETGLKVTFEIGLQIANDQILSAVNRGHTVEDFVDSVRKIKKSGFSVCSHLILNLPDSTMDDVIKTACIMNELQVDIVKLHSLYIAKDSEFGRMYQAGELTLGSEEEYVDRAVNFIGYLDPGIAISRIVSRIPEDDSSFSNWDSSWWKIYNDINQRLEISNIKQGSLLKPNDSDQ